MPYSQLAKAAIRDRGDFGFLDIDTRPKAYVCKGCSRDVIAGTKCICIASKPWFTVDPDTLRRTTFVFKP